ncbi:hypothetical protein PLICRDRAFT_696974 [Plicaturopsis crispa FD-325 SS-3]|nr:hypothetical protein PLICRDRAFT_696974 [Plicaturopsis crispa FD-325 SS-3]
MASWVDVVSFLLTAGAFVGVILGVLFVGRQISLGVAATKESLKNRGLHITDKGVSVKTSKRFDREHYVDATQRGFIKVLGSSSFGQSTATADGGSKTVKSTPVLSRHTSSSSSSSSHRKDSTSSDGKRKSSFFGKKRAE